MKVRINRTPDEREIDGVALTGLLPGAIREVSPSIGSWLIAEGYAVPEMRVERDIEFSENVRRGERERRHSR